MFGLTPFERNNNIMRSFHDFEKDFWDSFGGFGMSPAAGFSTDIKDEGDHYLLEAELPGFDKEDISIDVDGSTLTISAEHSGESEQKDDNGYIRRERRFGSYRRSFDIGGVDESAISAEYKNGVLKLSMPKKQLSAPDRKRIEIN